MHGIVAMANCPAKLPNLKLIVRLTQEKNASNHFMIFK